MNYGVQKCIWTALGDVTANIFQATLVIFFIGSFISDHPLFLSTFKWIGVIYISYLAYDIYKSKPKNIELICVGNLGGDRIYYNLGF